MPITRRDFVRTLFSASQTALVAPLLVNPLRGEDVPSAALNFAILGDWGRQGRPDQAAVARQMAVTCGQARASFIVSLGDNFYENGVRSVLDLQWQTSFENVYTDPALQLPWYVILGNHDYRGSCDAQLEYSKAHPRWIMPARYYRQVYPVDASTNMECFYLDTSPMMSEYIPDAGMKAVRTQDVPLQLAWLDRALADSTAAWKLVFGHHPIYSAGLGHGTAVDLIRNLLPILQRHNVQAYFAGHDHDLQHLQVGNLHMIVSGGGSEHLPVLPIGETRFGKAASGFALATVRSHELQVRLIDEKGRLLHTGTLVRV